MTSEWRNLPLQDVVSLVIDYRGKTPKKLGSDWSAHGYRAFSAKNIKTGQIVQPESIRFADVDLYKKWMKEEIQRRDILVTSEAPFGEVFLWDSNEKIVLSQCLFALRCKSDFYPPYIFYYMTTAQFQAELRGRATGTTVTGLRQPELLKCSIKCPNYPTQVFIADTLYALDKRIANNKAINHQLEQMTKMIYKSWFVDFEPWDGIMPNGWRTEKIGNLCRSVSQTHPRKKEKLIFFNTGDIDRGLFLHSTYSLVRDMPGQAKKSIEYNDILYSEIRPINKHYAYVSFNSHDYIVSTKLLVIRATGINSRRLYHYLTSEDVIAELQMEAESRSGTFPQIRFDNIQNMDILLATPEIEEKFATILNDMYNTIELNNAASAKLAEIRDILLPRLMSGKLKLSSEV